MYVLECEDNMIYIGETIHLNTRFIEHLTGNGGATTSKYKPHKLVGLYRVNANHSFMKYKDAIKRGEYNRFILDDWVNDGDSKLIENHITKRYLWERRNNHEYGSGKEWYRVRGGKYTYNSLDETLQISKELCSRPNRIKGSYKCNCPELASLNEEEIVDRPLCNCGYPSEVKLSKDRTKIYFECSLKNVWNDFFTYLSIASPCNFWQIYTEDIELKKQYSILKEKYDTHEKCLIKLH